MNDDVSFARTTAWILGAVSVFCSGLFQIPFNLQGMIVYGLALVFFWIRVRRQKGFPDSPWMNLLAGLTFSVLLALTTNSWLVFALHASIWFLLADLLLRYSAPIRYSSATGFLRDLFLLAGSFFFRVFSAANVKELFGVRSGTDVKNSRARQMLPVVCISALVAIVLFYVFHLLFSGGNSDYAKFMDPIIRWLWSVFFKNLCFSVIHAYLLFAFLTGKRFDSETENKDRALPAVSVLITLAAVILVTAVFAYFQTRFIIVDAPELKFADLSKYTQQGFFFFFFAIGLGYFITLFAIQSQKKFRSTALVVFVILFVSELILGTFFSAHKLYLLQSVFGLKDERILASAGVLFIFFSFVLLLLRLFSKRNVEGFRFQILFLFFIVLIVNVFNVDLVSTRFHPIRYYRDQKSFPDYSYLLGNSYDNVSEWPRLMREMREQDPPHPGPGYFWGFESSGGSDFFRGTYKPLCAERISSLDLEKEFGDQPLPTMLLVRAYRKYHKPGPGQAESREFSLSRLLDFNLREYNAYRLTWSSQEQMRQFQTFLDAHCSKR